MLVGTSRTATIVIELSTEKSTKVAVRIVTMKAWPTVAEPEMAYEDRTAASREVENMTWIEALQRGDAVLLQVGMQLALLMLRLFPVYVVAIVIMFARDVWRGRSKPRQVNNDAQYKLTQISFEDQEDATGSRRMRTFYFTCSRSAAPEHQVAGVDCSQARLTGSIEAASSSCVVPMLTHMCTIAGTWSINIGTTPSQTRLSLVLAVKPRIFDSVRRRVRSLWRRITGNKVNPRLKVTMTYVDKSVLFASSEEEPAHG